MEQKNGQSLIGPKLTMEEWVEREKLKIGQSSMLVGRRLSMDEAMNKLFEHRQFQPGWLEQEEREWETSAWRREQQERAAAWERLWAEREEREAAFNRWMTEHDGLYWNRLELPVIGPPVFCFVVGLILSDLRTKAPRRYDEVIFNLPKAEYAPSYIHQFAGRSDGLFSIDGSGYDVGRLNTYEWLRFVLLHEAGHCVGRITADSPFASEQEADDYANTVLTEMGYGPYRISGTGYATCGPLAGSGGKDYSPETALLRSSASIASEEVRLPDATAAGAVLDTDGQNGKSVVVPHWRCNFGVTVPEQTGQGSDNENGEAENSELTTQDKGIFLQRQLQAKEEALAQIKAELCTTKQQIEELKERLAFLQEKEKRIAELEQQVTELQSQLPVGSKVRIKDTHERDSHVHHYRLEINDQENGVLQPIRVEFAVDDEGHLLPPTEEEA